MNLVRTTSSTATRSTRSPNTIGDARTTPGDIFRLHAGDDDDRAVVAKCTRLRPLQLLCEAVRRDARSAWRRSPSAHDLDLPCGQGAKALSLVCRLPTGRLRDPRSGGVQKVRSEGACAGARDSVYMDDPSSCWTSSLYPSSMISVNLSHDTLLPPGDEGQALKRALGLETSGGLRAHR
jgi:hypothetical protein